MLNSTNHVVLLHVNGYDLQEVQIQLQKQKKLQTSWRTVSFEDQWDPAVRVGPGHEKHSICLVSETKKSFQIAIFPRFFSTKKSFQTFQYLETTISIHVHSNHWTCLQSGQILVLMFTKWKIYQLFFICSQVGTSGAPIPLVACSDLTHGGRIPDG